VRGKDLLAQERESQFPGTPTRVPVSVGGERKKEKERPLKGEALLRGRGFLPGKRWEERLLKAVVKGSVVSQSCKRERPQGGRSSTRGGKKGLKVHGEGDQSGGKASAALPRKIDH